VCHLHGNEYICATNKKKENSTSKMIIMKTEASLPHVNIPIRLCYACLYFHSWEIGRGHIIYQKYPTIIMEIELTITSGGN
jgi:hypothetical protein